MRLVRVRMLLAVFLAPKSRVRPDRPRPDSPREATGATAARPRLTGGLRGRALDVERAVRPRALADRP